jgi:hypothetical protein
MLTRAPRPPTPLLVLGGPGWTPQRRPSAKGGSYPEEAWPHERRCPEEDVTAAEAALGAGEDEAEGEAR